MERLTEKSVGCFEYALKDHKAVPGEFGTYDAFFDYMMAVKRLGHYEDTGMEPEEIKKHEAAYNECLTRTYGPFKQKISQWLQAEKEARLVVIPWAAGDVIYEADPAHGVVKHTFAGEPAWMMHSYAVDDAGNEWYDGWGSSDETPFYKTREGAEAALAGKGGTHEADTV